MPPKKKRLIREQLERIQEEPLIVPDEYIQEFTQYIKTLPLAFYDTLLQMSKHSYIKRNLNNYLNIASQKDKEDAIQLYELVNSDNFLQLLKSFNEIPIHLKTSLQTRITSVFTNSVPNELGLNMYREIMIFVKGMMKPRDTNTSVAYLSSKNVEITEDVENLGIVSFHKLLENFDNFVYMPKSSASDSIILTGELSVEDANVIKVRDNLKPSRYYFKVFPVGYTVDSTYETVSYDSSMLQFELVAYRELFKLVKYNITPNILCKLTVGYFDGFYKYFYNSPKLSPDVKKQIRASAQKINNKIDSSAPWNKTGVIITHPGGSTLNDIDIFKNLTILERKMVMFQILYTLYVFEELEISHGDLHPGNVFIIDVPPTELCYIVQDTQYKFITTKMVKIYDYDHSTITKSTDIKLNTNKSFKIDSLINPDRAVGEWLNTTYAETNIFNKNLDICILILYGFSSFSDKSSDLEYMEDLDPDFDSFIQDIMPGFDYRNYTSNEKIVETYTKSFSIPERLTEMNRIYNVTIDSIADIDEYGISDDILNTKWLNYGYYISDDKLGRIIKSTTDIDNNHLYIPDNVIIPKWQMLNHSYFDELTSMDTIDITIQIVYTLDGRISKVTEV